MRLVNLLLDNKPIRKVVVKPSQRSKKRAA
jgi:hypothetical protein